MIKAKDESTTKETTIEMAIISKETGFQFRRVSESIVKKAMEDAEAAIDAEMDD